jgi:hypothetical protein
MIRINLKVRFNLEFEEDENQNEKSLGAKIMKFHKLLVEMTGDDTEYLKQFENEKKFQQMMTINNKNVENGQENNQMSEYISGHTPKSGAETNELNFKSITPHSNENYSSYMSTGGDMANHEFRTNSQIEREKDYDRLFSHLEEAEEENTDVRIKRECQVWIK